MKKKKQNDQTKKWTYEKKARMKNEWKQNQTLGTSTQSKCFLAIFQQVFFKILLPMCCLSVFIFALYFFCFSSSSSSSVIYTLGNEWLCVCAVCTRPWNYILIITCAVWIDVCMCVCACFFVLPLVIHESVQMLQNDFCWNDSVDCDHLLFDSK